MALAEPAAGFNMAASRDDAALAEIMALSFYDALGVQPGATNADVRRAFKAAALKHHPDKGGDARIFRYLSTVRDILLNKAKRERYDYHGRAPFEEEFSKMPSGGAAHGGTGGLPGQRVLFAPISDMLEKMAADEAWATQRWGKSCLLYTSPSPRDRQKSRMPSSA